MTGWQTLAESVARRRCAAILDRLQAAIGEHSRGASVDRGAGEIRASGRGLKRRWLTEPGLRFARRLEP